MGERAMSFAEQLGEAIEVPSKRGPRVGDIFWVAVCHPPATPDGPANFIGPYSTRQYAEWDVEIARRCDGGGGCRNQHYVGHHRWMEDISQRMHISVGWMDEYVIYNREMAGELPEGTRYLYGPREAT